VVVVDRGSPRFVRTLPTGGHDITEAIASSMSLSEADAEAVKRQVGIGMPVPPGYRAAAEAVAQIGHVLVEAVRNTLSFYSMKNPSGGVDTVLLTGGGAGLPGLGQYLSTAARVGVSLADPLGSMKGGAAVRSADTTGAGSQSVAVSVGLAMGAAA
jgi:type IV pilus assembly protein PilM